MGGAGNLRDWVRRAEDAGATVRHNSAGELSIEREGHRRVRVKATRKDCPRALITLVRRLEPETRT